MIFRNISFAAALVLPFAPALAQDQSATPAEQASPATEPAASQTAPAEGATAAAADTIVLAQPADVKVGAVVNDQDGQNVGTIETVEADGAVIATGKVKGKVPLSSFGKKGETLVVGISKSDFEAAVAQSTPSATQ
ncbi:hypothetical protein [Sphingosinicella rhizophila]|uniref:PRC-barrel domain-containing protein n=1 Tax=Sphingosinicella rhizophila TaxID=3050082 RepID=A0ABU3Q6L7_9SPHN|nr:hypothetical protein [Sphingosinicella sp. GR2756]MDT9598962.1 hypothetical protein [Sphingosinicella sp. GR2756]